MTGPSRPVQVAEPLVTAAQMRALEAAEIDAGRVSGWELMCRAGKGIVDAILAAWPDLAARPRRAVVLCGPGNNGGDGFVVARLLFGRGWRVRVLHWGTRDRMSEDAQAAHDRWAALGPVEPMEARAIADLRADLFVDAIFGTGLSREVPELVRAALGAARQAADASAGRLVAVDMPSWFSSDSGAHLGGGDPARFDMVAAVRPMKLGQFTGDLPNHVGCVEPVDIGLPAPPAAVRLSGPPEGLEKRAGTGAHKYTHGHALVLAGGAGRTGAARLAARA
ncbi:NAD(P)H-hydrate epimerase, partial [Rhodosalinus sp.]|uniref:NAD(P)H-hydrate epimerase n=1 Tax=Rhodosalinus sp. TaxID=2047741 RepID=UPI00397BFD6E